MESIDLGRAVVEALIEKYSLDKNEIDAIAWGGVILPTQCANVGREIALDLGLADVECSTVTRACTSSLKSIAQAVSEIERGDFDLVIAGGSDSTSNAQVTMPNSFVHKAAPVILSGKSGPREYLQLLRELNFRQDMMPQQPAIRERSTGELMGQSAEKMGVRNAISREAMDSFAVQSHQRAAAAWESGRFDDEVIAVKTPAGKVITKDNIIRGNVTAEKMAKLKGVFAKGGNLTAGNSSPLTDGAAACLIMSEEKARALGYKPLAAFRSWSFDSVDPFDQMLMGPAQSMPISLAKAGMQLKDVDIIDIHEAFAAQVLSVLRLMSSDAFARQRLARWGYKKAVGEVDPTTINLHGGSISIGHPFGATGARMVTTMANELQQSGKSTALLGICGAGGVSAGAVMEAV